MLSISEIWVPSREKNNSWFRNQLDVLLCHKEAVAQTMETQILENTIIKLGTLLALGQQRCMHTGNAFAIHRNR